MTDGEEFTRGITHAYFQSNTKLKREVYIQRPDEMGLDYYTLLKVVKPLYGIPETGLHWY